MGARFVPHTRKKRVPRKKVLVVENDPDARVIIRRIFEEEGYIVLEASTGLEALDTLEHQQDIWLVIGELALPGIGGLQFAREVKQRYPAQRMFLLTEYTDEETIPALAYRVGYDAVLFKPIVVRELKEMLNMLLRQDSQKSTQK